MDFVAEDFVLPWAFGNVHLILLVLMQRFLEKALITLPLLATK